MINKEKTTQWHKEKVQQKNYDQQKENYTMTQRKSTTKKTMINRKKTTQWHKEKVQQKKIWLTERKLHNDCHCVVFSLLIIVFCCTFSFCWS